MPMRDKAFYRNKLYTLLHQDHSFDCETLIEYGYDAIEKGNFRKAFRLFALGYRLIGNHPEILNGLGLTLCEMGKLKFSKNFLLFALKKFPDNVFILSNLATVYFEEYDYDKAIYFYTRAINVDPFFIEAHINLINVYFERGDIFMAYISCLDLLKKDPDNYEVQELCNDIILNMGLSLV